MQYAEHGFKIKYRGVSIAIQKKLLAKISLNTQTKMWLIVKAFSVTLKRNQTISTNVSNRFTNYELRHFIMNRYWNTFCDLTYQNQQEYPPWPDPYQRQFYKPRQLYLVMALAQASKVASSLEG